MAIATITDLEKVLYSVNKRWTIGSSETDTLTSAQAQSLLDDELAKMKLKYGITVDGINTGDVGAVLVRIQCLRVMLSQKSQFSLAEEDLTNLKADLADWEKSLNNKPSSFVVDQSKTSIFPTPEHLRVY